jgi:uncharacterized protein YbaR (Trm112 family)
LILDRMAIDPEFLAILVCPVTHRPLRKATAAELGAINALVRGGKLQNAGGQTVAEPFEAGLAVAGEPGDAELVVYPIRTGIPVLLAQEAIRIAAGAAKS